MALLQSRELDSQQYTARGLHALVSKFERTKPVKTASDDKRGQN